MAQTALTRERRCELLAIADGDAVQALASDLLDGRDAPDIARQPEVGMVMMEVREPVCAERFHLGEVLVTRSDVSWLGADGWAMRLGNDPASALAAALCDALAAAEPEAAADIDAFCRETERRQATADAAEWNALAATEVVFEELD